MEKGERGWIGWAEIVTSGYASQYSRWETSTGGSFNVPVKAEEGVLEVMSEEKLRTERRTLFQLQLRVADNDRIYRSNVVHLRT